MCLVYKNATNSIPPDFLAVKRSDSVRSRRKVSAVSERSDTSDHLDHDVSGEESPGVLSNDELPDSPADAEADDDTLTTSMPWMRAVVKMTAAFNVVCTHQNFCHPYCFKRHMRSCKRLLHAVRKVGYFTSSILIIYILLQF